MGNKKKMIALLCAGLLPLTAIGLGIVLLVKGFIFNFSFALCYIILPLFSLFVLYLTIFSNGKVIWRTLLSIIMLIVFVPSFLLLGIIGPFERMNHYEDEEIAGQYQEVRERFESMPTLSGIGAPERIDYYEYAYVSIFGGEAGTLICKYNENEYAVREDQLEQDYTFWIRYTPDGNSLVETVELDGFVFRFLAINGEYENEIDYPRRLIIIGTNDTTREIAYIAFYNVDYYSNESLADFINNDCGWKYIK